MSSSASAFSRIEEIDRNFKNLAPSENLQWIDAFDPRLSFRGHGWVEEARAARSFRRFPDRAVSVLSEAVQQLSRSPASVFLAFRTDATEVSVRVCNSDAVAMNHMPLTGTSGVELYWREGRDWVPLNVSVPTVQNRMYERRLVMGLSGRMREYRLYLPLYKHLEALEVGFSPGSEIHPLPASSGEKPILFYGTSITQGGCANTAGSDFVSYIGRLLERDTINLGFSGNGKGEPEIAELIGETHPELIVLDYFCNCDLERVKATLAPFLDILRRHHPRTPIVLLSTIALGKQSWDRDTRDRCVSRRDEVMRTYLAKKEAGDTHLYFVDGEGILPPRLTGTYVDGVHPTSHGFNLMAERLAPHLANILHWEAENAFHTV